MTGIKETPKPEDYFLRGSEPTNDISFLAPARSNNLLLPLVDGVETFRTMEENIAKAKNSVYIAFWIFNPYTPLQSSLVRKSGMKTWADLLRETAKRGVDVRILLTDFDPVFGADYHRNNWRAYQQMALETARLVGKSKDLLQTIVSLHPATLSVKISSLLTSKLSKHIKYLNARLAKKGKTVALDTFAFWPGLWRFVEFNAKAKKFAVRAKIKLYASPVAHHQKICIVDETVAFCGGLDVNKGRISTPNHDSLSNFWHDLDVRVEGEAALDICRNFIGRWNSEVPIFENFVKDANATSPPKPMILTLARPDLTLKTKKLPPIGKTWAQVQRTRSVDSALSSIPRTVQDDIKQAYKKAISQAQEFIYIENQYVRSPELGEWIINQVKKQADLRVLIVLPVAPEEVGKTGKGDEITEHGLALQNELFSSLRTELKDRVGIYSLIMKVQGKKLSKTEIFGSPQIYVHSKLLLIDDYYANISSANANPRSFYVDTEIATAWLEPSAVKKLRLRLWNELLGSPTSLVSWKSADFVKEWDKIAISNEKAPINKRQGFVVRHDGTRFPGTKDSSIPHEFASIFNVETGNMNEEFSELV